MRALLAAAVVLLVAGVAAGVEAPRLTALSAPAAVNQWARFEARGSLTPMPANPFDPAELDLQAVFVGPDGVQHRVIGFYYQDFSRALVNGRERLTPVGVGDFRVRFTPGAPGEWRLFAIDEPPA